MRDLKRKSCNLFLKFIQRYRDILAFLVIFVVISVFFYPVWFENKVPLPADALVAAHVPWTELKWEDFPAGVPVKNQEITDSISQFFPWRSVVGEFWRAGKVPLWNPYMFSGTPFLATWHSAALYPLNIFYLFLSDISAWTLLTFSQIFLSASFMYLFLRSLNLNVFASLLGAISFSFSGYMIAWSEFATGPHAGLWLPLLLLFEYEFIKRGKKIWFFLIPFIFFFIYTAGDFQVPFYETLFFIFFGFYLVYIKKGKLLDYLKIVLALVLGVLLSLPQLLPTFELFSQSIRLNDPYIKEYFYGLMHWEKLVNFIWPDFFGNVVTGNYWGRLDYHEYLSFVGVVTLLFAFYSLTRKKRRIEKFFWISLLIVFIFLFPTPLAKLPYILKFPGLGTSLASRIIFLADFLLSCLGAYGLSKWHGRSSIIKMFFIFLSITLAVALGIIFSLYLIKEGSLDSIPLIFTNLKVSLKNMIPSTIVLFSLTIIVAIKEKLPKFYGTKLVKLLVLTLLIADLIRFSWKNTVFSPKKFVYPETSLLEFLKENNEPFRIAGGIPLNLFMYERIESVEGYDPIYPLRNSEWFSIVNSSNLSSLSGRFGKVHNFSSPLLDFANLKYIVDFPKDRFGGISEKGEFSDVSTMAKYREVFREGRVKVFENKDVLPRVWLGTNYKVARTKKEVIENILGPKTSKNRLIVLENEPYLPINPNHFSYSINNYQEGFNEVSFDVKTTSSSLIFLSQSYYPGWNAYVDGKYTKVLRANYIFQSIAIPSGVHHVAFKYEPKSFTIGLLVGLSTFVFLLFYTFCYGKK